MGYSQKKMEYWRGILAQYASGNDARLVQIIVRELVTSLAEFVLRK